jgi:hypothetical protein
MIGAIEWFSKQSGAIKSIMTDSLLTFRERELLNTVVCVLSSKDIGAIASVYGLNTSQTQAVELCAGPSPREVSVRKFCKFL